MKQHLPATALDRLIVGVLTVVIALGVLEHYAVRNEHHDQICAIRAYIEGQFAISAGVSGADPKVVAARRSVIQTFEDRMDGNCQ